MNVTEDVTSQWYASFEMTRTSFPIVLHTPGAQDIERKQQV